MKCRPLALSLLVALCLALFAIVVLLEFRRIDGPISKMGDQLSGDVGRSYKKERIAQKSRDKAGFILADNKFAALPGLYEISLRYKVNITRFRSSGKLQILCDGQKVYECVLPRRRKQYREFLAIPWYYGNRPCEVKVYYVGQGRLSIQKLTISSSPFYHWILWLVLGLLAGFALVLWRYDHPKMQIFEIFWSFLAWLLSSLFPVLLVPLSEASCIRWDWRYLFLPLIISLALARLSQIKFSWQQLRLEREKCGISFSSLPKYCLSSYAIAGLLGSVFFAKGQFVLTINSCNNDFLDLFFRNITHLGSGWSILAVVLLFAFRRQPYYCLIAIVSIAISTFLVHSLKLLDSPRPQILLPNKALHFVEGVRVHKHASFPSGHSATVFVAFTILSLSCKKRFYSWMFFVIALVVVVSRIYLLQHFFIDTYVGAILGVLSVCFTFWFLDRFLQPRIQEDCGHTDECPQ